MPTDPHPPLTEHCVLCGRGSPGVWTCANPDCLEPSFEIRYVEDREQGGGQRT